MATNQIEKLIGKFEWKLAQQTIEKQLEKDGNNPWLGTRLSAVKHEQHNYEEALEAADKALAIVPDCPLALWSQAGAMDMLGKTKEALKVHEYLFNRGLE